MRRRIESIIADADMQAEIAERIDSGRGFPASARFGMPLASLKSKLSSASKGKLKMPDFDGNPVTEAIILLHGRPSLIVQNGTFKVPDSEMWKARLYPHKSVIERLIRSVGRVELVNNPDYQWVGTAWVVGENTVITNRHVAMTFARRKGQGFSFLASPEGLTMEARVDFREEYRQTAAPHEIAVDKIVFLEEEGQDRPDYALLHLSSGAGTLPPPIPVSGAAAKRKQTVVSIGYPAYDSRNPPDAMHDVFEDVYDVKRVAPGEVTASDDGRWFLNHDCSTLGGASGSVLGDVETGQAVGLHFGGSFRKTNYAVTAATIRKALSQLRVVVSVPDRTGMRGAGLEAKTRPVSFYKDRAGYEEDFLGPAPEHKVPLPRVVAVADVAPVTGAPPNGKGVLRYTHFSVVLSKSRRMSLLTAVNIDGNQLRNIPRKGDSWFVDPRVSDKFQTLEAVYSNNDLDRGHMVRRLDPVWGSEAEARKANDDTFHYANACPQHKDLNQRTWNDLEDYILGNSGAHDFKVCVFTGPVLRKDDAPYRGVRLPREFWKVAVLVNDQTGKLSTTGYMLSQAGMIKDLTEFVFGKFRTYQVPVARIEKLAGLNFGKVADFDPLRGQEMIEAVDGPGGRVIERPGDIVF